MPWSFPKTTPSPISPTSEQFSSTKTIWTLQLLPSQPLIFKLFRPLFIIPSNRSFITTGKVSSIPTSLTLTSPNLPLTAPRSVGPPLLPLLLPKTVLAKIHLSSTKRHVLANKHPALWRQLNRCVPARQILLEILLVWTASLTVRPSTTLFLQDLLGVPLNVTVPIRICGQTVNVFLTVLLSLSLFRLEKKIFVLVKLATSGFLQRKDA